MIFLELPAIKALYTQQIYCLPSLVSPPVALTSNTPSSNVNNETSKVPYSLFKNKYCRKTIFTYFIFVIDKFFILSSYSLL